MVLFNDTQPPKPPTLFGKILTWFLRLVLLAIVLIAFFIGALNLLQGSGETQKKGIEKTISSLTNKDTYISTLHNFKLFPEFILEFDGLKNGMFSDKKINIDSVKFQAPGALVIKKNGVFKDINIQNISFIKGDSPARIISSIEIIDEKEDSDHTPHILARISAPTSASLTMPLDRLGTNYRIKEGMPFSLEWGDSNISGRFFSVEGKSYMTGKGLAHLPSPLPFLNKGGSEITCFIARSRFDNYVLILENIFIRTGNSQELHSISSILIDLFSNEILSQDQDSDEALNLNYEDSILLKSNCAT